MICCLLALLVTLPGVSMLRRLCAGHGQYAVHCGRMTMGHPTTRQVAIACGSAFFVAGGALIGGLQSGSIVNHPFGPICSANDRATPASRFESLIH